MPALKAPTHVGTLAHYRELAGYTQTQVAIQLDTTQATVSRWESGMKPRKRFLPGIGRLYGLTRTQVDEAVSYTATLCSAKRPIPGYLCRLRETTGLRSWTTGVFRPSHAALA